jgi:hypothetical protein
MIKRGRERKRRLPIRRGGLVVVVGDGVEEGVVGS